MAILVKPPLLIATPIERTIDQRAFWSFIAIAQDGWPIAKVPYTRHDIACNKFISELLGSRCDYLLILDSSRVHPRDIAEIVGEAQEKEDADIVATRDNAAVLIHKEIFREWPPPWFRYEFDEYLYHAEQPIQWTDEWPAFYEGANEHGAKIAYIDAESPHIDECPSDWETYLIHTDKRTDRDVLVAVPMERTINGLSFHSFLEIARQGYAFAAGSYKRCDQARQDAAQKAIEWHYHLLMMLDSDHLHPPDVVTRLMARMGGGKDRLVVAGLNYRRSPPWDSLAGWWCKDKPGWDTPYTWPNQLTEVEIMGSGSMLINTEAFKKLPTPWFGYSYDPKTPSQFPGVDIWFCRLCQAAGIKLWLDPTMTSPHLTDAQVDRAIFHTYLQKTGAGIKTEWQNSAALPRMATRAE